MLPRCLMFIPSPAYSVRHPVSQVLVLRVIRVLVIRLHVGALMCVHKSHDTGKRTDLRAAAQGSICESGRLVR